MVKSAIITLVLLVLASGVGFAVLGPGFFGFNTQGDAQRILDQKRIIEESAATYASLYGKGEVHFGDPEEGEDIFFYLRDKGLMKDVVGIENGAVEKWTFDPESKVVGAVVKTEKLCKYMLFNESSRPLEQPVPECGTEEAEGMSCCADMGGS